MNRVQKLDQELREDLEAIYKASGHGNKGRTRERLLNEADISINTIIGFENGKHAMGYKWLVKLNDWIDANKKVI